MSGPDARDTLTVLLTTARRRGIVIEATRFGSLRMSLPDMVRDVREDLQALEGQLARCEEMARREAAERAQGSAGQAKGLTQW